MLYYKQNVNKTSLMHRTAPLTIQNVEYFLQQRVKGTVEKSEPQRAQSEYLTKNPSNSPTQYLEQVTGDH